MMFYDASAHQAAYGFWHGKALHVVTYGDINMRLGAAGKPTLYRTTIMAYDFGANQDGSGFSVGATIAGGAVVDTSTLTIQTIEGAAPNLGFPESYNTMVFDAAGNLYGITNALRTFRVNSQHKITIVEPVF